MFSPLSNLYSLSEVRYAEKKMNLHLFSLFRWATAILQTLTGSVSLLRSSLTPLLSTFVAVKPPSCHSKRLLSPVMPSRFRLYLWNSS